MMDKTTKMILLSGLLICLVVVVVMCVGVVRADAPSCWFYDDWGNCSGWCEPGNASCKWPNADFLFGFVGTAWGGNTAKNLNLTFGNPYDAGWAWGPFYCPAEGVVNISVKMKAAATAGAVVGLFCNDSTPLALGGGMWYDNSIYFGTNGFIMGPSCPWTGNYFALGVDWECIDAICGDPNCVGGTCDCTGLDCVFFFNTSGPYADTCALNIEQNQWLVDGVAPDNAWHTFAISFDTDTGETLCYFDGTYMGTIYADDMAGQNLYFQLYGQGMVGDTVYWDDFLLDSGSGESQDSSIGKPLGPTELLADGITNTCMYNATPNLSCVAWHSNGSVLVYQQIMVATDSVFNSKVWDTGVMNVSYISSGQRSNVTYNGSSLVWNTRYYWRTRFIDCYGVVGDWSNTAQFVYGVIGCGTYGNDTSQGIFPPTNISVYSTECSPSIFLKESWEKGATAMGFECPVQFEQMILGLMAIPIGFAAFIALGHIWVAVFALLIWFGGLAGMHVYPWWMVIVIAIFILSIWFFFRRTGN